MEVSNMAILSGNPCIFPTREFNAAVGGGTHKVCHINSWPKTKHIWFCAVSMTIMYNVSLTTWILRAAMVTALVDIGKTSVVKLIVHLPQNKTYFHVSYRLSCFWIFDKTNILFIFNMICNHTTVISMRQCRQIYSDSNNIILFCTCMCM